MTISKKTQIPPTQTTRVFRSDVSFWSHGSGLRGSFSILFMIPSMELTYTTWGKGNSSSKPRDHFAFWRLFALSKRKDPNYPSGFLLQKAQIFHHAGRIRGFPDSIFWGEGTPSDRFPTLGLSKLMGVDESWMFQGRFWMDVRALGNIPWIYPPPSNSHK